MCELECWILLRNVSILLALAITAFAAFTALIAFIYRCINVGLNYIFNQKTSINTSLGIGLTEGSPDFQFGVGVPIRFGF